MAAWSARTCSLCEAPLVPEDPNCLCGVCLTAVLAGAPRAVSPPTAPPPPSFVDRFFIVGVIVGDAGAGTVFRVPEAFAGLDDEMRMRLKRCDRSSTTDPLATFSVRIAIRFLYENATAFRLADGFWRGEGGGRVEVRGTYFYRVGAAEEAELRRECWDRARENK